MGIERKLKRVSGKKELNASVRLSQCMIVRDEEENIERALSWAKDIAFEQIVVDTGSTDRTVEIAEKMGAKVFHFEWIGDFSAAKNYALSLASGNWIAFLDADEFLTEPDAKKLIPALLLLQNTKGMKDVTALKTPCVQLDDEGETFSVVDQIRFFKNNAGLYYKNRIHESLAGPVVMLSLADLSVMHTGYSKSAVSSKQKSQRNVELIKRELEEDPDNADLKCYLADSLYLDVENRDMNEIERLYLEALESGQFIHEVLKKNAYFILITRFSAERARHDKALELCDDAIFDYPDSPDYYYLKGCIYALQERDDDAHEQLLKAEEVFKSMSLVTISKLSSNSDILFRELLTNAQKRNDNNGILHYSTVVLKNDKFKDGLLSAYLTALKDNKATDEELISILEKVYDFESIKDKLYIVRAAKEAGAITLAQYALSRITDEEKSWLAGN